MRQYLDSQAIYDSGDKNTKLIYRYTHRLQLKQVPVICIY